MSYRLRVFDSGKIPTRDDAARPISAVRRQQKQSCLSALFIVTKSLKKFTHKSNLCTPLSLSFLLAVLSLSLSPVVFTPFVFPLFLPRPRAKLKLKSDDLPPAPGSSRHYVPSSGQVLVQQHGRQARLPGDTALENQVRGPLSNGCVAFHVDC